MAQQAYETLNKAWKSTCRTVLGDEIGELEDYGDWLKEHMDPFTVKKSCVSGSDVYSAVPYYCEEGKFISLEEVDFNKKFEPLNINEIKDIDSIAESLRERFTYCGNVVLENSRNVGKSSNIQNSFHILSLNIVLELRPMLIHLMLLEDLKVIKILDALKNGYVLLIVMYIAHLEFGVLKM
jgi:hypothetical protein